MSGFSADWLAQREPLDARARDTALARAFGAAMKSAAGMAGAGDVRAGDVRAADAGAADVGAADVGAADAPMRGPLRIVDLAAGSGANFRVLAPLLGGDQDWLLVDHDPSLLAAQASAIGQWAALKGWRCETSAEGLSVHLAPRGVPVCWRLRMQQLDLQDSLEQIDCSAFDGVTTTAFLDLVSAAWLDRLVALLARSTRPLLAALSVDGRRDWRPSAPEDARIHAAFGRHQGGDKGFGAALGTGASDALGERLAALQFRVQVARSDWQIHASCEAHAGLLRQLVDESAAVAAETAPSSSADFAAWAALRHRQITDGGLSLVVGHRDLLAVPPARAEGFLALVDLAGAMSAR